MIGIDRIALGVLAGGQASRLGGVDKSRLVLDGATLLERIERAWPQPFGERLLSYNLSSGAQTDGWHHVPDLREGHPGPMAGIEALLEACSSEWLLTLPIDCQDIPKDLPERLASTMPSIGCVVSDVEGLQPLIGLWNVEQLKPAIGAALAEQDRAMHSLCKRLSVMVLDIAPHRLGNLNTPQDFAEARQVRR